MLTHLQHLSDTDTLTDTPPKTETETERERRASIKNAFVILVVKSINATKIE